MSVDPAPPRRRPSGWYAQLYRRTYGAAAVETKERVPSSALIGPLLVVGGAFTPWVRAAGDWISAATALDVPLRALWAGPPPAGGLGIWNDLTGLSVGFIAVVLALLAAVALAGWLPRWVKTAASIGIVIMPTVVATQINRNLVGPEMTFFGVVGPGMLLMLAGGVVLGLAKPSGTGR